jgi:CHAT domain-containing protein/lipopolysaccharide biosynthesis regulator YciM
MDRTVEDQKHPYRIAAWVVIFGSIMQAPASATHRVPRYQTEKQAPRLSQSEVRQLEVGKPIERELRGGESHAYEISISAGQYANVAVDQRGIDVVTQVTGPDGKQVVESDSPVGAVGPESVRLIAEASGKYRFNVRSSDKTASAGKYELRLVVVREATQDDRALQGVDKLDNEATELAFKNNYKEAAAVAERSLAIRERVLGPENLEVTYSLNRLAKLHQYQGDYRTAEVLFKRVLAIIEKGLGPNHLLVATPLNELATLYYQKGSYEKVEPLLQRGLAIYEKGGGPENTGVVYFLNNLAELYRTRGDYKRGEALLERALAILEKALGPDNYLVAAATNNLASVYFERGDYLKAEPLLQRALAFYGRLGIESSFVAAALNQVAVVYQQRGEYSKAEPLLQRAVGILERVLGPEEPDVGAAIDNLATLYDEKGDYLKAEPLFQRALAIFEKARGAEHPFVAKALNNLAKVSEDKGDYTRAESLYNRALAIFEKAFGTEHPDVARTLNNLAESFRSKGNYGDAEALFKRALPIYEKALGAEHPDLAYLLNNLALLTQNKGDYVAAEALFKRAESIVVKALGSDHPFAAAVLNNLAVLYQQKGDLPNALLFLSRASEIRERDFLRNLVTGSERQKLAYLAQSASEVDMAISWHIDFAPTNSNALQLAAKVLLRRKGRGLDAMIDAIASLRRRASPGDQKSFDQLAQALGQLAVLTIRGPGTEGIAQHRSDLAALENQVDKLDAEISARSVEFRVQQSPITVDDVQRLIPQDAALVEFMVYRKFDLKYLAKGTRYGITRYVAYIFHSQGEPSWVELGDAATIDQNIYAFRKALRDKRRKDATRLARSVDQVVMQPVRKLLGNAHHIFLSPDGALNLIPFAGLVDEHDHYLVEQYLFTYLTSGRDLLRLKEKVQSRRPAMVIADPDFGETETAKSAPNASPSPNVLSDLYFSRLEQTEREAEEIKLLFPQAEVLNGSKATEAALKQASGPQLLHVATHGFFLEEDAQLQEELRGETTRLVVRRRKSAYTKSSSEAGLINPLMRSGLALAGANTRNGGDGNDGILTALEATGLDLWGTKLVVLSACDTGLGQIKNGDGLYGLRRALVLAGSESQMMSLWPVSDRGTRELMIEYYRRLKAGEGRSEALRRVQLRMLANPKRSHPFYWASFIQSGEWANLDGKRID